MTEPDYTKLNIEHNYSRRGFMYAVSATAFLAACGGSTAVKKEGSGSTSSTAAAKAAPSGTMLYYNWADYVNPKTYPAFTKATGVKVQKDFFKSNEELEAKLQGGATGYDLAAPTGYMVQILAEDGKLEPIDWSLLPNVKKNIDPKFQGLPYDPDNKWSVPKDWGTPGFLYRSDKIKEKPTSWEEFYALAKGAASGKVTVLDGIPEVI